MYILLDILVSGTWVPPIASHMFDKPVNFWNWWMTFNNHFAKGVLMYLSRILSITKNITTISMYSQIVDAPTSNLFHICLKLKSWSNIHNTIAIIFLIFSCALIGLKHFDFKTKNHSWTKWLKTLKNKFYNASNIYYLSFLVLYVM
jgi:hypothetical protein